MTMDGNDVQKKQAAITAEREQTLRDLIEMGGIPATTVPDKFGDDLEMQFSAVAAERTRNREDLVRRRAIPFADIRSESNDDLVVGTHRESIEKQSGGRRFTRPMSRTELLRSLKS